MNAYWTKRSWPSRAFDGTRRSVIARVFERGHRGEQAQDLRGLRRRDVIQHGAGIDGDILAWGQAGDAGGVHPARRAFVEHLSLVALDLEDFAWHGYTHDEVPFRSLPAPF